MSVHICRSLRHGFAESVFARGVATSCRGKSHGTTTYSDSAITKEGCLTVGFPLLTVYCTVNLLELPIRVLIISTQYAPQPSWDSCGTHG
jgi:hypothetical protein